MPKRLATGVMEEKVAANEINVNTTPFLERVARILLSLSKGTDSISEISKQCGTSLSTTHRILHALKKPGFSRYDENNRRYYLGPLITQLSTSFQLNHRSLFLCALADMQRLSEATGEVIAMRVMVGMQSFQLYEIPATQSISVNLNPPAIEPIIPVGPINMLFLSRLNDRDLRETIKSNAVSQDGNLTEIESFVTEIKQVRRQGYALATGHRFPGVTVLAVAVEYYSFPVALCLVGLESRLAAKMAEVIELVKQSSENISRHLLELNRIQNQ